MKELKDILKQKCFVINPEILRNICSLEIDIKEFLLLLYFINIKNDLDLENIKKYFNFKDEDILNIFNSLVTKKLIEVIVKKTNKQIEEEISLELFYDKLILNSKEEKKETDIFSVFESEFGRTLSPIEYEMINKWLESNVSEETIKSALKEAVINGVNNFRYIDKIIFEWTKKGRTSKKEEEYEELFDYNWLDDKE